jgi:hypothetical protein
MKPTNFFLIEAGSPGGHSGIFLVLQKDMKFDFFGQKRARPCKFSTRHVKIHNKFSKFLNFGIEYLGPRTS